MTVLRDPSVEEVLPPLAHPMTSSRKSVDNLSENLSIAHRDQLITKSLCKLKLHADNIHPQTASKDNFDPRVHARAWTKERLLGLRSESLPRVFFLEKNICSKQEVFSVNLLPISIEVTNG